MDKYRRRKQIDDKDIDVFKEIEINKILTNETLNNKSTYKINNLILKTSTLIVLVFIIFIGLSYIDGNQGNTLVDRFEITKVSASEYKVESEVDDRKLFFYYKAYIVYENDFMDYDDEFSYKFEFREASRDHANNISIEFDAIRIGESRFFIKTILNGQVNYVQINSFTWTTQYGELDGLELGDFEQDLKKLFALIEEYPPVSIGYDTEQYEMIYDINPNIELLEDSKNKENYINYVKNYYQNEQCPKDIYCPTVSTEPATYNENHMIVLNENGEVIRDYYKRVLKSGGDGDFPPEKIKDLKDQSFSFYIKDTNERLGFTTYSSIHYPDNLLVRTHCASYSDSVYAYFQIPIKDEMNILREVNNVVITYKLNKYYQDDDVIRVVESDAFILEDNLIIPPNLITENRKYPNATPLFKDLKIDFYNSSNELIYTLYQNSESEL